MATRAEFRSCDKDHMACKPKCPYLALYQNPVPTPGLDELFPRYWIIHFTLLALWAWGKHNLIVSASPCTKKRITHLIAVNHKTCLAQCFSRKLATTLSYLLYTSFMQDTPFTGVRNLMKLPFLQVTIVQHEQCYTLATHHSHFYCVSYHFWDSVDVIKIVWG